MNKPGDCQLNGHGKLNQAGVDLETDFYTMGDRSVQPETKSIMTWMDQRKFMFSLDIRGSDENVLIPLVNGSFQSTAKYVLIYVPMYLIKIGCEVVIAVHK